MMPIQCATCEFFIEEQRCQAFPELIPEEFYTSEVDHDHPVEGQVGNYVWKKRVTRGKK
jgi:hypothetical protein